MTFVIPARSQIQKILGLHGSREIISHDLCTVCSTETGMGKKKNILLVPRATNFSPQHSHIWPE